MKKIIAYCGMICSECPIFIATKMNDNKRRRKIAQMLNKKSKKKYKIEDINCEGCLSESKIFHFCNICEIRNCARKRKVRICTECEKYPCEKLSKIFKNYPKSKERLEKINLASKFK